MGAGSDGNFLELQNIYKRSWKFFLNQSLISHRSTRKKKIPGARAIPRSIWQLKATFRCKLGRSRLTRKHFGSRFGIASASPKLISSLDFDAQKI